MRRPASPPDPQLLLQHAGFVRGIARGLLFDADGADDIVQDTWLAALRHPPRGGNLRAWLAVVARNLASRVRRSAKRRAVHEARGARPDALPSAAELAARIELQRRVLDAVERLEEPFRSTLLYRYFDGLAPAAIAERLGVPVKTVKSRLHRALRSLRADLGRAYGGDDTKWSALLLPMAYPASAGGAGSAAAIGGIALAMKKWIAVSALLLFLLGAAVVVRETARGSRANTARSDRAPAPAVVELAEAAAAPQPPLMLREDDAVPAFTFAGRVVDAEASGIGGAEVRLVYWTAGTGEVADSDDKTVRRERERRERPAASTDPDGYFRLDRPYASTSHLLARAEGFAPAVSEPCVPGAFLLIRMARTGQLRVTAVRADGQPVPDAAVRLVTSPLGPGARAVLAEAVTDVAGIADLPVPAGSGLWIEVSPRDPALASVQQRASPAQDAVVVKLPSQAVRTCRIVDARTAAPVPDAYVIACRGGGLDIAERRRFLADAEGRVQVPWGADELRFATAPGYDVQPVVAPEIQLWPAMRIEGSVVDDRGRPVPDAAILLAMPPGALFPRAFVGMGAVAGWSDAEGRFAIDEVTVNQGPPDARVRSVIALHADHPLAVVDGVAIEPGGRASVDLRFPAPASLEIEITDPAGAPMPQQWVMISRQGVNVVSLEHGQHTLVTDARGRAEATLLPPGRYVVRSEGCMGEVEIAEGAQAKLKLVKGAGPAITGRVLKADGSPAANVCVGVRGAPGHSAKLTDAEGRFRFADLPDFKLADVPGGRFAVQVVLPDWRGTWEVPAKIGEDLVISLPSGPAKLRIEVEGLPPDAVVNYALATRTGARVPDQKWAGFMGAAFETQPFTPGKGLLFVRVRGHGAAEVEFEAEASRTTIVGVRLVPNGSVQGEAGAREEGIRRFVRIARKAAVAGSDGDLRRRLGGALGDPELAGGIGPDGAFRISEVPPGAYRASLWEGTREVRVREIEVSAGESTTVSFDAN
jgi:RNA polymerase sigma-70 factor (ECF subfamily)